MFEDYYIKMPIEEKRKLYMCGSNYCTWAKIDTWSSDGKNLKSQPRIRKLKCKLYIAIYCFIYDLLNQELHS